MKISIAPGTKVVIDGKIVQYTGLTGFDSLGAYHLFEDEDMNSLKFRWIDFLQQEIFQSRIPDVVEKLRLLALEKIRDYIKQNGGIYPSPEATLSAVYFDRDGYAADSYYSKIQMTGNSIIVDLEDYTGISEDDLSITHVLQILELINK